MSPDSIFYAAVAKASAGRLGCQSGPGYARSAGRHIRHLRPHPAWRFVFLPQPLGSAPQVVSNLRSINAYNLVRFFAMVAHGGAPMWLLISRNSNLTT
jgi:hypothetical protein